MAITTNLLDAATSGLDTASIGTWTAAVNTSIVRDTTRAYQGSGCLRLTATAAGTVGAVTGAVPISAGAEYMAFALASGGTAVAGRQLTVQISWYDAASVLISSVTGAIATLPNSATLWTEPPAHTIAVAPPLATQARVQVAISGVGAGSLTYVDTIALGPPALQTGNLLRYADQGIEMDTAGWVPSLNCAIARSTFKVEGWYSLGITATAAGDVQATSVPVPVSETSEYFGYAYLRTPIALSAAVELWWYDAASTLVGTTTATVTTAVTTFERLGVSGRPPAGATQARLVIRPTATAPAQVVYADQMTIRVAPRFTGNLLPYAVESMETDLSGWEAVDNASITRTTAQASSGLWSMQVTTPATGQARVHTTVLVPVLPDTYYVARQSYRSASAGPMWTDIDWFAADGTTWLGSGQPDQDLGLPAGTWWANQIGRRSPAEAAFARVVSLPGSTVAGQIWWVDTVALYESAPPYEITADAGSASVTLVVNGANSDGATTISVYRIAPDGSRQAVRTHAGDAVRLPVTGSVAVFTDHEPPLGVDLRYIYTRHAPGPPIVDFTTGTTAVVVDPPTDPSLVWLSDPGQPARSMRLMIQEPPDWQYEAVRAIYRPRGRPDPIVRSTMRHTGEGDLTAYTWTSAEDDQLRFVLETGAVLLLRARPGWGLDHLYISVGSVANPRLVQLGSEPARGWTLPLTIVSRPVGGIAGSATRTWQSVRDDIATPTWADVVTTYSTWLDVLQGV